MKRTLAVLLLLLLLTPAGPAQAQLVVIDPPHTILTWYHAVVRAYEVAQRVLVLYRQGQQIYLQVKSLERLASQPFTDLQGILELMDAILASTNALHYDLANLDTQFREIFPGWQPYSDAVQQRSTQVGRTLETARGLLLAIKRNANNLGSRNHALRAIQTAASTADSHQKAAEIANSIASFNGQELLMLRQTTLAQANLEAIQMADRANKEAQQLATRNRAFQFSLPEPQYFTPGAP